MSPTIPLEQSPFHLGVIADNGRIARLERQMLEKLQGLIPGLRVTMIDQQVSERSRRDTLARALYSLNLKVEQRLLAKSRFAKLLDKVDARSPDWDRLSIIPEVSPSGFVFRYSDRDIEELGKARLDVVVHFGSGILKGAALAIAKHGILSFHHADNRLNRGGPAGFWEVYQHSETTGFTLQVLTEELDGGRVICRGSIPTKGFALLNRVLVRAKSMPCLTRAVVALARGETLPELTSPPVYAHPLYRLPRPSQLLRYSADLFGRLLARFVRHRLLRQTIRWQVAFQAKNWRGAVLHRFVRIPNPPGHFLADPFVVERDGQTILFVEDQMAGRAAAFISAYRLSGSTAECLGPVIVEPFHLSFPFVFEFGDDLFMVPESGQARQVRIYRCVDFPLKWELASVALDGVAAFDSMVFERGGRWWMLTNMDDSGANEHCSELHLYHAADPLAGPWIPARENPVLMDARRARNGGMLRSGDDLFRVGQRQGFDSYGAGFGIYRITRLDEAGYDEICVAEAGPDFFPDARRTHHLFGSENYTVVDFATYSRMGRPDESLAKGFLRTESASHAMPSLATTETAAPNAVDRRSRSI